MDRPVIYSIPTPPTHRHPIRPLPTHPASRPSLRANGDFPTRSWYLRIRRAKIQMPFLHVGARARDIYIGGRDISPPIHARRRPDYCIPRR